ncbi:MAG TPA: dihydrofolate reductase family protein [Acidimicrobiia bacterium]|nr:dihydrofolate reductase family protein [Acidimicrobiia bacterium]
MTRKLVVDAFVSLDGVMQAPGGPDEDTTSGFPYGGWQFGYGDEAVGEYITAFTDKPYDLLLGRTTYEIFNSYWPHQEGPMADGLNTAHHYVASRTLRSAPWKESTIIRDVPTEVAKLKQEDGPEIQTWGSTILLQTLWEHDLVDAINVLTYPVTLGNKWKHLFGDGTIAAGFKVVDSQISPTGIIMARYERAGDVKIGSFDQ